MPALVGQTIKDEHKALVADPIIAQMAQEASGVTAEQVSSWTFVRAAGITYKARGGQEQRTIGGPARAIAAVLGVAVDF